MNSRGTALLVKTFEHKWPECFIQTPSASDIHSRVCSRLDVVSRLPVGFDASIFYRRSFLLMVHISKVVGMVRC